MKKNSLVLFLIVASTSTALSTENKNHMNCSSYGANSLFLPSINSCLNFQGSFIFNSFIRIQPNKPDEKKQFKGPYFGTNFELKSSLHSKTDLGDFLGYMDLYFGFDPRFNEENMPLSEREKRFRGEIYIEELWFELGNVRMGRGYSPFIEFADFGGPVMNDSIIPYGPLSTINFISYTYDTKSPLSFVAALENHSSYDSDSFSTVGGVRYTSGLFTLTGLLGFDTVKVEITPKIRIDVPITDKLSLFAMGIYGQNELVNLYKGWKGNLALWGGGTFKSSDNLSINFQGAYAQGELIKKTEKYASDYSFGANVDYEFSKNFHVIPEINYFFRTAEKEKDVIDAQVRFKRSF